VEQVDNFHVSRLECLSQSREGNDSPSVDGLRRPEGEWTARWVAERGGEVGEILASDKAVRCFDCGKSLGPKRSLHYRAITYEGVRNHEPR